LENNNATENECHDNMGWRIYDLKQIITFTAFITLCYEYVTYVSPITSHLLAFIAHTFCHLQHKTHYEYCECNYLHGISLHVIRFYYITRIKIVVFQHSCTQWSCDRWTYSKLHPNRSVDQCIQLTNWVSGTVLIT